MHNARLPTLVTKLFGIALLLYSLEYFVGHLRNIIDVSTFRFLADDVSSLNLRIFIAQTLCFYTMAALGTAFVFFTGRVLNWLVRGDCDEPESEPKDIQSASFSIIGALVICLAVPDVVDLLIRLVVIHSQGIQSIRPGVLLDLWPYLIGKLLQLILGLYLFLGSVGLKHCWRRLQTTPQ